VPRKKQLKIAVIDAETDPFKYGRIPKPFAWGFFDGEKYVEFWGKLCTELLLDFLDTEDTEYLIFAHNGGKFDFFFLIDRLENPVKIINGRIVKAKLGKHTLQDSYAIMPYPLAGITGGKLEIDYSCMESNVREAHKEEILKYLRVDCEELYKAVSAFVSKFGVQLTIGGTAFKELKKLHPVRNTSREFDEKYRHFYFGGRCQAFKTGVLNGPYKVFDVNSMYPDVMRRFSHPLTDRFITVTGNGHIDKAGRLIKFGRDRPYFIRFSGINRGALPLRIESGPNKGGLDFTSKSGIYHATSHEIIVALKHKMIEIKEVFEIHIPCEVGSFGEYVDMCMNGKLSAEERGDMIDRLFYKLLANSAYGKFAQNPDNFFDWAICKSDEEVINLLEENPEYDLHEKTGEFTIWKKPSASDRFNNVATAASITGASRACLLDALGHATDPVYSDTDSIICRDLSGVDIDRVRIGAWKHEADLDRIYIAGKKLYAGYDSEGECVKLASKGARLSGDDIQKICMGGEVEWANDPPSFQFGTPIEQAKFTKRTIRAHHL